MGEIVWNCYHSQCNVSGKLNVGYSLREVANIDVKGLQISIEKREITPTFNDALPWDNGNSTSRFHTPNSWISPLGNTECVTYINTYGLMDAYADKRVQLFYDPGLKRVIFPIKDSDNSIVGAVGRSLSRESKPKWLMYGNPQIPFMCRSSVFPATYVIVEDAASAVKVSSVATGFALLGSAFLPNYWNYIHGAKRLIIAMDKDASKKAVDIQRRLVYYKDTAIVLLEDDIKNMTSLEIERKLEKHLI